VTPEESQRKIREAHGPVYEVVLKLVQKNSFASPESDTLFRIRDSLQYRAQAVTYHLWLIQAHAEHANKILQSDLNEKLSQKEMPEFHKITTSTTETLLFLMDDLIFSAASYFDYLAKLFFYIITAKHRMHDDWKKLKKEINAGILGEQDALSTAILTENARFIRALHSHRSSLIHNNKDKSNGQEVFHWTPSAFNRTFKPSTPAFFTESFPEFEKNVPADSQNLISAAEWLTSEFFRSIVHLSSKIPNATSSGDKETN